MTMRRNAPRTSAASGAVLQWANGKPVARFVGDDGRFTPIVGWHIEVGRDDDLDRAMHGATTPRIEIKHQRPGGSEIVEHWYLGESVRIYPVTNGPRYRSIAALVRRAEESADDGIGVRWRDGERSQMAVRCYVEPLVKAGYLETVQLGVRSRMTDVLLEALLEHIRVCEVADGLIDREKHPDVVCLHELALPLAAGDEAEWGKGDTATVTPFRSTHPADVTKEYLTTTWRPPALHDAALAAWDAVIDWAHEYRNEEEPSYGA